MITHTHPWRVGVPLPPHSVIPRRHCSHPPPHLSAHTCHLRHRSVHVAPHHPGAAQTTQLVSHPHRSSIPAHLAIFITQLIYPPVASKRNTISSTVNPITSSLSSFNSVYSLKRSGSCYGGAFRIGIYRGSTLSQSLLWSYYCII